VTPGLEGPGALQGVRVVELASEHGALAGKILADLGAEVVVVEPPGGHRSRRFEPFLNDNPHAEGSLWWWYYNTGKLGVTLDVARVDDVCRFRALVATSDVILEGESPGTLARLAIDYAQFEEDHPNLVWVSITPFGRTSRAQEPATDLTILAGAGPVWSCGYDDQTRPPVRPGGNQGYHAASLWAVMGALVALHARPIVGGQRVDVSMHAASNVTTEAATYEWLVAQATVQRQTLRHAAVRATPTRIAQSSDGYHVIGATPRLAEEFGAIVDWIKELGVVDQVDDFVLLEMGVDRGGVLVPEVESDPVAAAIFQAGIDGLRQIAGFLPARIFFVEAQRRGLPVGVVFAPEDIVQDEHFAARGFPIQIRHEEIGRSFTYPGAPFRASGSPWRVAGRAPLLGEHNDVVLTDP
jgi:benzylsuccinate CoA-transferase BbsE subunit